MNGKNLKESDFKNTGLFDTGSSEQAGEPEMNKETENEDNQ